MSPLWEVNWRDWTGRSYVEAETREKAHDKAMNCEDFGHDSWDSDPQPVIADNPMDPDEECEFRLNRDCAGCPKTGKCEVQEEAIECGEVHLPAPEALG